jgi:hypothetical protein
MHLLLILMMGSLSNNISHVWKERRRLENQGKGPASQCQKRDVDVELAAKLDSFNLLAATVRNRTVLLTPVSFRNLDLSRTC